MQPCAPNSTREFNPEDAFKVDGLTVVRGSDVPAAVRSWMDRYVGSMKSPCPPNTVEGFKEDGVLLLFYTPPGGQVRLQSWVPNSADVCVCPYQIVQMYLFALPPAL